MPTVQAAFEEALARVTGETVISYGAGRTDTGVHALGQVAHVSFQKSYALDRLRRGTNFYLRDAGVVVVKVEQVPVHLHARFSAHLRCYRYRLLMRPSLSVLREKRAWWMPKTLNIEALAQAAPLFEGTHDFAAFRAAECQARTSRKTVDRFTLLYGAQVPKDEVWFEVAARSFLHHQVRLMVGTCVQIGKGSFPPTRITELLEHGQRGDAGPKAPAHGLYLTDVVYPEEAEDSVV